MPASRFACPSSGVSLTKLLRQGRGMLFGGLVLAIGIHLSVTRVSGMREAQGAVKPLTMKFVKREPRLTKPLEMKKQPRPKRRQLERKMVVVKAQVTRQEVGSGVQSVQVLRSLARPHVPLARAADGPAEVVEPQAVAQAVEGAKESKDAVDMSLEMVDVEALDTGRYQAMVIQDPEDKRNIKGYVHLALAYPFSVKQYYPGTWQAVMRGLRDLVGKLNEWTDIRASIAGQVTFDSAEFLRTPWTYLSVDKSLEPTRSEVQSLGKYLLSGGFFYFEGQNFQVLQGQRYLMHFLESALQSQGYREGMDWEYEPLPNSHPLFHCYYEFPDGPPPGHTLEMYARAGRERNDGVYPWARGVEIDGHMTALNTNQLYGLPWAAWGRGSGVLWADERRAGYSPTLQFRFGINTIIFALTQEGSITRRVMDSVR